MNYLNIFEPEKQIGPRGDFDNHDTVTSNEDFDFYEY